MTLITERYLNVNNPVHLVWDDVTTTSSPATINPNVPTHVVMVAGTDISYNGSLAMTGALLAHEQVKFANSGTLTGLIMAEDACEGSSTWPCDGDITINEMTNSPRITYNCGWNLAGLSGPTTVSRWLSR